MSQLKFYNSFTRNKEVFQPINPPFVGMYVCGPTVSGESHLGHARPYVTFDVVFRYLTFLGYKVRYVRNITDVGHFEEEGRSAVDKVSDKAKLEQLEPMELTLKYTRLFHEAMLQLGNLPPSIEPTAAGHIPEQLEMIKTIMDKGLAYEVNGSVYFDVRKFAEGGIYGQLSGRKLDEMIAGSRELEAQDEKRDAADFALWKNAPAEHILRWKSPWGEGYPGWHIECSAMATRYLGKQFDIHGGGMDLQFPHHESEIAQSHVCNECLPVNYWLHNNMITVNGKKMGKSYNNTITLRELFGGTNPLLQSAYSPMTVRFLILQTHYRSTLDFSNEALQAAEKGLKRLLSAWKHLKKWATEDFSQTTETASDSDVIKKIEECHSFLNDDLNTAEVLARLFELCNLVNSITDGHLPKTTMSQQGVSALKNAFDVFLGLIFGLKEEESNHNQTLEEVMKLVVELRLQSRLNKDYATSDKIRDRLHEAGITLKDGKEGTQWQYQH